jgi:dipeptidyl aminopeptidase/acylaminoacyl peptidase
MPRDVYLINVKSGDRSLLKEGLEGIHSLSPDGRFFYWYASQDSNYYVKDLKQKKTRLLTGDLAVPLYNDWNDAPTDPKPFGVAGWSSDNRYLLVYDRFDIWKLDALGKESPVALTKGAGRQQNLRFRYLSLDADELAVDLSQPILLSAFQIYNKQAGFYSCGEGQLRELLMEDASFAPPVKALESEAILVQKGDFKHYPELHFTSNRFESLKAISLTNPQQSNYRWGDIRLVSWSGFNGVEHQGLLVTPEGMDTTQKYPMLIYYYERLSDRLHNYYSPAPSRSTINWTFYASNGYVVFIPDITYRTGDPGLSAFEAIMSGTQSLLERYSFIDEANMGLQGQSWGGYQTAFMVTRTNRFKAAMAGAPVSNMTSAYGAIRWGTGMSRMFQYEHTQSRIGGTLWEALPKYIENSPVFFVPQINTPLLIMHNDNDGAVPWYQGIEFFTALRRLNKPAWMLVYNNEEHNLTRRADSIDLSRRMMQFFNHYLKGAPAPPWMTEGVSALEKEKGLKGFE